MQSSDLTDMGNQCRTDNMFVGENHLCIQQHTMLNTSLVVFCEEILKQTGYSLYSEDDQRKTFECELPVFGSCSVTRLDAYRLHQTAADEAVGTRDYITGEAVVLKIVENLQHGLVETLAVSHSLETIGRRGSVGLHVGVELGDRHTGVSLGCCVGVLHVEVAG